MTRDPVELKALLAEPLTDGKGTYRIAGLNAQEKLRNAAPTLARQVLALSEEVELTAKAHEADTVAAAELIDLLHTRVATAEADAKALRQRLGEISEIADETKGERNMPRVLLKRIFDIAALAAIQDGETP